MTKMKKARGRKGYCWYHMLWKGAMNKAVQKVIIDHFLIFNCFFFGTEYTGCNNNNNNYY